MSLNNMYPWVHKTRNFIRGRCPHACKYCYVKSSRVKKLYDCEPHLVESAFRPLGKGKTIFVGSMFDMWAEEVATQSILEILEHCKKYPYNVYLFQTKNPSRFIPFARENRFPSQSILGTTMETNRFVDDISKAPPPMERYKYFIQLPRWYQAMASIEPITDFDLEFFVHLLRDMRPDFVSIGADSKGHNLPEPSPEKVRDLIAGLKELNIEVKIKDNLKRLLPEER